MAALITLGQLVASINQSNSAIDASKQAESALKEVQDERSRVEEIKGRMQKIESSTQETSHAVTAALLQLKTIEARVHQFTEVRQREIQQRASDVEAARATYKDLQEQLDKTAATIDFAMPRVVTEKNCTNVLLNRICVSQSRTVTEVQKRASPEFASLQQKVEAASQDLQAAEGKLAEALSK